MRSSPDDDNFISGIYNYCDRWCERCELTNSCRVFAEERESAEDEESVEIGAVIEKLTTVFAETKQMLIQKAEELGVDPFELSDEEFAEICEREKQFVDGDELSRLAGRYRRSAREILHTNADWLEELEAEDKVAQDVMAVIRWYLFFIPAKISRGLRGLLDDDGFEDPDQAVSPQSDANGAIKICIIAIERSVLAWTYLADADQTGKIPDIINLLERIKTLLEARFPLARDFIRPGFDEVGGVM
jgi:hypothetical protein